MALPPLVPGRQVAPTPPSHSPFGPPPHPTPMGPDHHAPSPLGHSAEECPSRPALPSGAHALPVMQPTMMSQTVNPKASP